MRAPDGGIAYNIIPRDITSQNNLYYFVAYRASRKFSPKLKNL